MAVTLKDLLYATVAYADIFGYPLTQDDLYFRCMCRKPGKNLRSKSIPGVVRENGYFFLRGRQSIVKSFIRRANESKKKWEIARTIGNKLRIIPTIYLVGVTGGLAVNNASKADDIDLCIIVSKGSVWISRLLAMVVISVFGRRRKFGETHVENAICLNMVMADTAMRIPDHEQDMYSAHEVLQMEPLWSRRDTYRRFLKDNDWVQSYLPVAWDIKRTGRNQHPNISYWWTRMLRRTLKFFEVPAKLLQMWYMRNRRSTEVISDTVLRFHPSDARVWIKKAYEPRLKKRNIPLDIVFYRR